MNAALDAYLPKSRRVPLSPGYAEQEGEEAGRSVYDLFQLHLAVGGWGRVAVVQIVGWGPAAWPKAELGCGSDEMMDGRVQTRGLSVVWGWGPLSGLKLEIKSR